ncbi:hypothetical protein BGZ94_008387 [Podila epigama]|nr:hypothetical protein BGZ94_008387 [Podila epigama]
MSSTTTSSVAGIQGEADARVIPMTRRPDGTYRKERKVRPGYIPPEDVVRYSNRVLDSVRPSPSQAPTTTNTTTNNNAAPKSKSQKKNDKRKAKRKEDSTVEPGEAGGDAENAKDDKANPVNSITPDQTPVTVPVAAAAMEETSDPEKKLRALSKKLRQIEQLKERQDNGEELLPEQTEKISKMHELLAQIEALSLNK